MSLASSMKKVTGFTNKLLNITRGSQLGTNIPSTSITRALGIDGDSVGSIESLTNTIRDLKDGITNAATLSYCAYNLASIDQGLAFIEKLALGLDSAIESILDQIIDSIATQISNAAQQLIGAFVSLVDALANLVSSVLLIADSLVDLWNNWSDWSNWKFQWNLEKEACLDMYSSIAGCLLNKFLGSYLDDFTDKVVGKINEVGNNFNNALYDSLQDVNTFSSYANQEAFLLKKASIQIKGLTKENLLDS